VDGVVQPPSSGKLGSESAPVIRLRVHPKLVDTLRVRSSNDAVRIVAFKLTHGEGPEGRRSAVSSLFGHSGADIIVHNDLSERAGPDAFPSDIHFADGRNPEHCATRLELAAALERILTNGRLTTAHTHARS
jgi:hypothetical protein